jgi:hypothetical protein
VFSVERARAEADGVLDRTVARDDSRDFYVVPVLRVGAVVVTDKEPLRS